jgi:hypothetical protein
MFWVSGRYGNKLPIRRVEVFEASVFRETVVNTATVRFESYQVALSGIHAVTECPFHKGVASSVGGHGSGFVLIFLENLETFIEGDAMV